MDVEVPQTGVAIVGVGQMAMNHYLPALMRDPRVTIRGLVDPAPSQRFAAIRANPGFVSRPPAQFANHLELLTAITRGDIPPIRAAFVLTHPAGREEIVEALLEFGIDVMQEKPFAIGVPAAQRLFRASIRSGRQLACNHQYRVWTRKFRSVYETELTRRATYGREQWIRIHQRRRGAFADPVQGGIIYDLATHLTDPVSDMDAWPLFVEAQPIRMPPEERLVHVHSMLTTERGMVVEVRLSDVLATRTEGTAIGLRRGYEFEIDWRLPTREAETSAFRAFVSDHRHGLPFGGAVPIDPPTVPEMVAENIRDFVSCVRGEKPMDETALTTAVQGVKLTRTLALLHAAHHRGEIVTSDELE